MKNLLYKEFHLLIHPLFYLVLLFGALLLIPEWVYFVAVMYFFFIALPNIFSIGKAQNDIGFFGHDARAQAGHRQSADVVGDDPRGPADFWLRPSLP